MVVTQTNIGMGGRLGNSLFAIASCIGIAKANDMAYTFPNWKYQRGFKNPLPCFVVEPEVKILEEQFHYEKITLNKHSVTDLVGYWQSPKYWEHCKEEVLKYFEFKDDAFSPYETKVLRTKYDEIAIHVRRGDYLTLPDYHPILPMSYYEEAVWYFKGKKFLVFSDDIEWCKQNFIGEQFSFSQGDEIKDLRAMAQCQGHILANSSFSWWGHYLSASKYCIAPKQLFGSALSHHDTKDWYLPHMKLI